jgi:acyl carrier protein
MNQSISNTTVRQSYTAEDIQAWMVSHLAEQLGVEPNDIDIREPFNSYGLDSMQAMLLASKAERFFGFKLSPILLWNYPTIELLTQRLAKESEDSKSDSLEL